MGTELHIEADEWSEPISHITINHTIRTTFQIVYYSYPPLKAPTLFVHVHNKSERRCITFIVHIEI